MNEADAIRHIREDTPLNKVRSVLSSIIGRLEQAEQQKRKPTPIERRIMEFEAVEQLERAFSFVAEEAEK